MKDQIKVSEILADHFANIADGIDGTNADLWDLWFQWPSKCAADRAEIKGL